ncbi:hypothetical protein RFI_31558 [Reticulomyxa filosa]|uniref:Uncharacterized protein n=1 Tax=Reticulomyxa filosa TaxID=46433 RepID=X6LW42_RETFI|nr:hypothetical protein RFI_31558 [Reticulomyxa filosa]|eukprot:ETO05839.1 hypothetical protein RFI_31558 [Reticulomyxa filosa]
MYVFLLEMMQKSIPEIVRYVTGTDAKEKKEDYSTSSIKEGVTNVDENKTALWQKKETLTAPTPSVSLKTEDTEKQNSSESTNIGEVDDLSQQISGFKLQPSCSYLCVFT